VTYGASGSFAGIVTANSYNQRLQPNTLSAATTGSGSQTVLSLSYDFHLGVNDNGNVYAILNNRDATRSASYSYDPLNRVATAETSQSALWGQSFGYDAWGNLLSQTVTQGTAPPLNVTVNGKNQITNTGFCYDSAGNLLGDSRMNARLRPGPGLRVPLVHSPFA